MCASNGIRAQYRYDKNDMQTEVLYGNGLRTSYTYDERSQLTGMESVLKDGRILHKASYSYDNAGNRITRDEQYTSLQMRHDTTCYTYDSMGRLTKESLNGAVTSYGYDLAGNRITKSTDGRTEKYFYNNRNQLTELHREKDVVRYSYDPAGNLTEENYHTADEASTKRLYYTYNVYNRNVSVTGDDFTQKNHYDAEGYRDSITEKDKVTNFVYQGGMLLHELDEDKNPARHYVLGNEYIGLDHNYYLTDEQGSVRYVLDAAGNVQNDYRYDAFGQRIAGHENIPNRLRYNAQIEDDLTGLYYLRARYYNTGIGRFTQEDVIYNDGLNLYAYCSSNPVMYEDPSGYAGGSVKQKTCGSKESGTETDLFLPDEFYNKNLPNQVAPGTKYLPKYDELGNVKQIKMYDDYGREIGWVDYTNHGYGDINSPHYHTTPHWHEKIYNAQYPDGIKINHRTDVNTPLGDK